MWDLHRNGDCCRKTVRVLLSIGLVLCFLGIFIGRSSAEGSADNPGEQKNVIADEAAAIGRASAYMGLDKPGADYDKMSTQAEMVNLPDDKTPMVAGMIRHRDIWQVDFHDVAVGRDDSLVIHPFWVRRDFTVLIDPLDGRLLSVYSLCDSVGSSDTLPEPPADAADEYLAGRGIKYVRLPDSAAKLPLLDAFRSCIMRQPAFAKVVRAVYVDYSTRRHTYPHRWLIILRGTDKPMVVHGPDPNSVPLNQRNTLLYSIDAETGRGDFMINAPYDLGKEH
jgi:hypothetical protein